MFDERNEDMEAYAWSDSLYGRRVIFVWCS